MAALLTMKLCFLADPANQALHRLMQDAPDLSDSATELGLTLIGTGRIGRHSVRMLVSRGDAYYTLPCHGNDAITLRAHCLSEMIRIASTLDAIDREASGGESHDSDGDD